MKELDIELMIAKGAGLSEMIGEERDRKLEAERQQCQEMRASARQVA
jgi:hypothetical protein